MLNHTYTSVKNANLVDCGKKQHIPSQPSPLLKENFLGEFRTELERKKVLANLGIATELSLEWGNIKGDIGSSKALTDELNARTMYLSKISGFTQSVIAGINYLETVVGGEEKGEEEQNNRLFALEKAKDELIQSLGDLSDHIKNITDFNITELQIKLNTVSDKVDNITELIKVSAKPGNALELITEEVATHIWDQTLNDNEGDYREATQDETATHIFDLSINSGEGGYREVISTDFTGLYVPDLSAKVSTATNDITELQSKVKYINDNFVTRDDLGGGDFDFVNQDDFDLYKISTEGTIGGIKDELKNTVKMGQDGHVNNLYVNTIRKENNDDNIKITDSFEVESGIPLDVRFVRENLEELYKLPVKVCYPGMGVIVNALSSLYILRRPAKGVTFNQEYIADPNNWKCPEDLVTVAMTRQEYEDLKEEEINPNVFYYIYEDEITRTQEPKREEYENDEQFLKEWLKWVDSLKTLSQEYMSAAWGVDIENKLGKKANLISVNILGTQVEALQAQFDQISGGDNENSIANLAGRVTTAEEQLEYLLGTEETDTVPSSEGKITEIETSILELDKKVNEKYVSIESITTEKNPRTDYIFVKKEDYESDEKKKEEALQKQLDTKLVNTESINLLKLSITSDENDLLVNSKEVALLEEVPIIIEMSLKDYNTLVESGKINHEAYYYITNEESYVTQTDLTEKLNNITTSIVSLANTDVSIDALLKDLNDALASILESIDKLQEQIDSLKN